MITSMDLAKQENIPHQEMYDHLKSLMEKKSLVEKDYTIFHFAEGNITKCYLFTDELERIYVPIKSKLLKPKPRATTYGKK